MTPAVTLTVSELIAELLTLDPELPVVVGLPLEPGAERAQLLTLGASSVRMETLAQVASDSLLGATRLEPYEHQLNSRPVSAVVLGALPTAEAGC